MKLNDDVVKIITFSPVIPGFHLLNLKKTNI